MRLLFGTTSTPHVDSVVKMKYYVWPLFSLSLSIYLSDRLSMYLGMFFLSRLDFSSTFLFTNVIFFLSDIFLLTFSIFSMCFSPYRSDCISASSFVCFCLDSPKFLCFSSSLTPSLFFSQPSVSLSAVCV